MQKKKDVEISSQYYFQMELLNMFLMKWENWTIFSSPSKTINDFDQTITLSGKAMYWYWKLFSSLYTIDIFLI